MKTKKLDDQHDITSTGWIIQRETGVSNLTATHKLVWETFVGPIPAGLEVRHINGVKNDNCLDNLRLATKGESSCEQEQISPPRRPNKSSSKYRGVSFCKPTQQWTASFYQNGTLTYIGSFVSEVAAALARDIKVLELGWPVEGTNFFSTV